MEKRWKSRTIQIPEWMNTAVSTLAKADDRDTDSEIALLVKSALDHDVIGTCRAEPPIGPNTHFKTPGGGDEVRSS
jgi:hypothetical protein